MIFLGDAKGDHLAVEVLLSAGDYAGRADVVFKHSHDVLDAFKKSRVFGVFFLQKGPFDPLYRVTQRRPAGNVHKLGDFSPHLFLGVVHDGGGPGGKHHLEGWEATSVFEALSLLHGPVSLAA